MDDGSLFHLLLVVILGSYMGKIPLSLLIKNVYIYIFISIYIDIRAYKSHIIENLREIIMSYKMLCVTVLLDCECSLLFYDPVEILHGIRVNYCVCLHVMRPKIERYVSDS